MSKLIKSYWLSQQGDDFAFLARVLNELGTQLSRNEVSSIISYVTQNGRTLSQLTEDIDTTINASSVVDPTWLALTGDPKGYNVQGIIDNSRFPLVAFRQQFDVYFRFNYVAGGFTLISYAVDRYP